MSTSANASSRESAAEPVFTGIFLVAFFLVGLLPFAAFGFAPAGYLYFVGPPLDFFAERTYIGGELPNTPDTLVHWIMDAPSLIPATAMPRLGVSEADARDIAAYLYTLH